MPKKYGGLLDEPMPDPLAFALQMHSEGRDTSAEYLKIELTKLDELADHYEVPRGNHTAVALALARDFIPGFQQAKRRRGAHKKWDSLRLSLLYVEIHRKIDELGLPENSIMEAAKEICEEPRWVKFLSTKEGTNITPDPAEALRKAYYEAARNHQDEARNMWKSFCDFRSADILPYWDSKLDYFLNGE